MDSPDRIADILAEYQARKERGEPVSHDMLLREHPELADDLAEHLESLALLEGDADDDGAPRQIGEFRIVREIGRGGMGVVYEAEQGSMRRRVALKVLYPAITALPDAIRRFRQEAWAAGRIKHTNIVSVYHLAKDDGYWYAAMELVEGRPLDRVLEDLRGRRPRESRLARRALGEKSSGVFAGTETGTRAYYLRVAEMFAEVADALHVAHGQGVIHRDIKPSNLLLEHTGSLKVVDFGLARLEDAASLTTTGDLLGTPYYMSPEQIGGQTREIDHRSDIYALGATLYETLALRPPFRGKTVPDLAAKILKADPPPLRRWDKGLPRDLETIVLKALEKLPDERYQTAREMARDLECFAVGETIRARRTSLVTQGWRKVKRHKVRSALAAALLVAVAGAGILWSRAAEADRARDADERQRTYLALLNRAQQSGESVDVAPADLCDRAIALMPDRPEAYFLRAYIVDYRNRLEQDFLRDLDAAVARGLPQEVAELARLVRRRGTDDERVPRMLDRLASRPDPMTRFFASSIARRCGDLQRAELLLDGVIDDPGAYELLRRRARWQRSHLREARSDTEGALGDLQVYLSDPAGDTLESRCRLAALWQTLGNEKRAATLRREILAESHTELEWRQIITAWGRAGLKAWGSEAADRAIEEHPRAAVLWGVFGACALWNGEVELARSATARAIELDPDEAFAHKFRADVLEHTGDSAGALAAIERAIELAPQRAAFEVLLASYRATRGEVEEAVAVLRGVAQRGEPEARAHATLGRVLLNAGRYEEALAAVDAGLKHRPRSADLHGSRALVLIRLGRLDEARAAIDRSRVLDPRDINAATALTWLPMGRAEAERLLRITSGAAGQPAATHTLRGHALQRLGRLAEAEAAYRRALAINPSYPSALGSLANTLLHLNRIDEALELARKATAAAPDYADGVAAHGWALFHKRRLKESLALLDRAVQLNPSDPWKRCQRAAVRLFVGDLEGALEDLEAEDVVEFVAANPGSGLTMAEALSRDGQVERAERVFLGALAVYPDNAQLLSRYNHHLARMGRTKDRVPVLERLEAVSPLWGAPNDRANVLAALGRFEEAVAAAREAVRRAPKEPEAWATLSYVACRAGKLDDAKKAAREGLAVDPAHPRCRFNLAQALLQMQDYFGAIRQAELVLETGVGWGATHVLIGDACMNLGEFDRGQAAYLRAVDAGYDAAVIARHFVQQRQHFALARAVAERGLVRKPRDFALLVLAADAAYLQGDVAHQIAFLREAHQARKDDARIAAMLALALAAVPDPKLRDVGRASELLDGVGDKNGAAHLARVVVALRTGENEAALALLDQKDAVAPRVIALARLGRIAEAKALLSKLRAHKPKGEPTWLDRQLIAEAEAAVASAR